MIRFIAMILMALTMAFALDAPAQQALANNAAPAKFFSSMQDVPLVPGLEELDDQTVAFDKPEGRIVESVAEIESASFEDIKKAYADTLPQLGWKPAADNSYTREEEFLHLSFETYGGRNFVRVLVRPLSASVN